MNLKKFALSMSLLVAYAAAQDPATADNSNKIGFSQLRGITYNNVANNVAGGLNVNDLIKSPSLFADKKFLYAGVIESGEGEGLISWGGEGSKYIFGYTQDPAVSIGTAVFGYATPGFGLLLHLGLSLESHTFTDQEGREQVESSTDAGNLFGLTFSIPLGSNLFSAKLAYSAFDDNYKNDAVEYTRNLISLGASFGNTLSSGDFIWEGGLELDRYSATDKTPAGTENSPEARTEIYPYFNIGYTALKNDAAKVAWGFNNMIIARIYDQQKPSDGVTSDHSVYGLLIQPNILGEILLNDNLIAFGEVSHNILIASESQKISPQGSNDIVDDYTRIRSLPTEVALGLRLQGERMAIEARLANGFYRNIIQNPQFAGTLSGFIYF